MTKARTNADNVAGDISGVTAGTGLTGGGTSGTVTLTNDMATQIAAKGDLVVGTGNDTYTNLSVAATNGYTLQVSSSTTSGLAWAEGLPSQTGNSGKYLTTNGTSASWGTVNQPLTWTQRDKVSNGTFYKMEYNGSNLYVAVGGGILYTSTDAITWTSRTSGFGANNIYDVAYGNGLWVAVGQNGTITTSTDGVTWTARTSNMSTNSIYAVTYANSLWVAVGAGGGTTNTGGITYSSDGLTWTRKSQSLTIGTTYNCVVWNGTNWVVGATFSTNNYLYASTPSGTWTVGHTGNSGQILRIFWDGTRHITVEGNSYELYYSTSTTLGTTTAVSASHKGNNAYGSYYYYDGKLYLTNGFLFASVTPATATSWARTAPQWNPTRMDASSPFYTAELTSILVNASGVIIANGSGIWTSF